MDEKTIKVCDILIMNSQRYRVIFLKKDMAVLCVMDVSALKLICIPPNELLEALLDGSLSIVPSCECRVTDFGSMSESARQGYCAKRDFIRDIEKQYGPTYLEIVGHKNKESLNLLINKYGLSRSTAWRYIRIYLQSGMDESALYPKHPGPVVGSTYKYSEKPGRKNGEVNMGVLVDETVEEHFREALEHYKSGRAQTMQNAFDRMNQRYYSTPEINANGSLTQRLLPASMRPTFRQFEYYVQKSLSAEEKDLIQTSAQEQRNNKRLLLSDNLKDVMGPGDCVEMDEVEVDLSLVSQVDPDQTVGRPIVYAMVDVYTRMIIAVSVAFDNNSVRGLTNCLMNLAEDKVELCEKYGIRISPDVWPSGFIPRTIRADRGSEYRSKEAKRIFNELGINLELVPGGSGSLKGSVEQSFHQLHSAQNPLLENKGLIEKRHDSNHHREAMLTIEDFKRILYNFVITHNQFYMKNYPLTHDMIAKHISPIPAALWAYGVATYGSLRPISNKDQFYYSLMTPITAKCSRKGITYKGLYYMDFKDFGMKQRMYIQGTKQAPLEVRIDPRDVGAIYMLDRDKRLKTIPLNTARTGNNYQGMPLAEYLELYKVKKAQDKVGGIHNEELRVGLLSANEQAIADAEQHAPRYANAKGIREARAVEKSIEAAKHSVRTKLKNDDHVEELPEQQEIDPPAKEQVVKPMTVDEAFDLFFGGMDEEDL